MRTHKITNCSWFQSKALQSKRNFVFRNICIGKFENVEINLFYYQSQTLLNPLVDLKSPFAFKERILAHIVCTYIVEQEHS